VLGQRGRRTEDAAAERRLPRRTRRRGNPEDAGVEWALPELMRVAVLPSRGFVVAFFFGLSLLF
jgi:hypothetical protein